MSRSPPYLYVETEKVYVPSTPHILASKMLTIVACLCDCDWICSHH